MTESQDPDAIDEAILAELRAALAHVDPPPPDLDERVRFAIALESIDVEVARLQEDSVVASGARSTEQARVITFESDSIAIMVSVTGRDAGRVRIDGWLAPGTQRRVELRLGGTSPTARTSRVATTDESGRFVFDGVDRGLAQLVVHPQPDADAGLTRAVVTPPLML